MRMQFFSLSALIWNELMTLAEYSLLILKDIDKNQVPILRACFLCHLLLTTFLWNCCTILHPCRSRSLTGLEMWTPIEPCSDIKYRDYSASNPEAFHLASTPPTDVATLIVNHLAQMRTFPLSRNAKFRLFEFYQSCVWSMDNGNAF